jgi:hypothetical protein
LGINKNDIAIISGPPGVVRIRNANEYSGGYYECTVGTYFLSNGIKYGFAVETITLFTQYRGDKNSSKNLSINLSVKYLKYILILVYVYNSFI